MGLPNINIAFKTVAEDLVQRSKKGTVAVIVKDTTGVGGYELFNESQIPEKISSANKEYIKRAFIGNENTVSKVLVYVLSMDAENLSEALEYFARNQFDYLAGPVDITDVEKEEIANWIKTQRANKNPVKAVLPEYEGDNEGLINFTTNGIVVGKNTYSADEYASRIAGLIVGTPITMSTTYAVVSEVSDVERLSTEELDEAVDNGEFILFYDGEKVKVGRGVNSLTTVTEEKGDIFKKIKVTDTIDIIEKDIRMTAQDNYIGKYPNDYDSKCLLIMAIKTYLEALEAEGVLQKGVTEVGIDIEAQTNYLKGKNVDTDKMTEQQIKIARTDSEVFIKATFKILDAIEDITINCVI